MKGFRHLDIFDREEIEQKYNDGETVKAIAAELGFTLDTIYRELRRGYNGKVDRNGRLGYSADIGQQDAAAAKLRRRRGRNGAAV